MGSVATLAVRITGDVSDVQSKLGGLAQTLDRTAGKLQSVGTAMTASVSLPILGLGGAALKAAADNEQLQVAFTTMLGSADKAKTLMSDLAKFAAATPFESDEIQGAAKMLLAYGSSASGVTDEMRQLGDIAAGVGVPLKDLAYLYGTSRAQGRLFTADINQFTSRGIPIMEALASTMGVATKDIRGMVEAGKVGFPELQAALAYLTGEGGKFNGLMEAQSTTLSGLFSTLTDNISLSMIDIGNAISQAFDLKTNATKAIAFVETIRNAIADLAQNNPQLLRLGVIIAAVAAAAGPLLVGLGMVLKAAAALTPVVSVLGAAVGALLSPVGLLALGVAALGAAWAANFGGIRDVTDGVISSLGDLWTAVQWIWAGDAADVDWWWDIVEAWGLTGDAAMNAGRALYSFGVSLGSVLTGLKAFGSYLLEAGTNGRVINQWLNRLPEVVRPAVATLGQVAAALRTLVQTGDIGGFVVKLGQINWGGALASVQQSLAALRSRVVAAFQNVDWGGVLGAAGGLPAALASGVVGAVQSIDWGGALQAVRGSLAGLARAFGALFQSVDWGGMGGGMVGLATGVAEAVASLDWGAALGAASSGLAALRDGLAAALSSIDWGGALQTAGGWLRGLTDGVAGAVTSIDWGGALSAAGNWLGGLVGGVVAAVQGVDWGGALSAAGDVFGGLKTAVAAGLRGMGLGGLATALSGVGEAVGNLPQMFGGLASALSAAGGILGGFWAQVQALAGTLANFFAPALGRLQRAFAALPGAVAPLGPKLLALADALRPLLVLLGAALAAAADLGANALAAALNVLPGIVGAAVDQMTASIRLITGTFGGVVRLVGAVIGGDWTAAWQTAQTIVAGFVAFLQGTLEREGAVVGALVQGIVGPILDTLGDLGLDVRGALGDAGAALAGAWDGVAETFAPVLGAIDQLRAALGGLMQTGDLGAFIQSIQAIDWGGVLGAMGAALGSLASGVVSALQGIDWGGALASAGDWLAGLWSGIVAGLQAIPWGDALTTAAGWLDGLTTGVVGAVTTIPWGELLGAAGDFLANLWGGVTGALGAIPWGEALASAANWLDGLKNNVVSAVQAINWTALLGAAGNVFAGLETAVSGALSALGFAGAAEGLNLGAATASLQSFVDGVGAMASDIGAKIEAAKTAIQPLIDFLEPSFGRLAETVVGLPEKFGALGEKFGPLGEAAGKLGDSLGGFTTVGVIVGVTLSFLANTANAVLGALAPLAGTLIDEITTLFSGLAEVVNGLKTAFGGVIDNNPQQVLDGLSTAFGGIRDIIAGTFVANLGLVQTALNEIGTIVSTTLSDWGFGTAAAAVDGMVKSVGELLEKIKLIASGEVNLNFSEPEWISNLLKWLWPSLDLPDWIKSLLAWKWPGLNMPEWLSGLLAWKWPSLDMPEWLSGLLNWKWPGLEAPEWLAGLLNWKWPSPPSLFGFASGTISAPPGLAWVGENGPELMTFRGGERVYDAQESKRIAGAAGGGINITIQQMVVRDEMDIRAFAYQVADILAGGD